jgi:Cu(I)-responsive transcriptional regulator
MQLMNIGQAAAAAGVTPKMIRHYETLGLIPEAERTEAGYRLYGVREIAMLRFIRQSRSLGFSMDQIASLMSLWGDPARHSSDVKRVAMLQLEELEQRQRELDQMRGTLEQLVSQCRGDHTARCAILENLADPPASAVVPASGARARKALKEVRPGERRIARARRPARAATAASVPAHAALSAWAFSFSDPA